MNNPITARTSADVVAVALHQLGFTPRSSIVFLLVQDQRAAVACMRIDADPATYPLGLAARVAEYASHAKEAGANGTLLLSFEDDKAMTTAQFEAIGDKLAAAGLPILSALLITGGHVMDYEGDGTDAEPFAAVQASAAGLELHIQQEQAVQLPEDVPAYSAPNERHEDVIHAHAASARELDPADEAERAAAVGTLRDIVDGYTANGSISADHAAWLAGTTIVAPLRDLLAASLVTSDTSEASWQNALLGNTDPESWDHLRNAGRALYAALGTIPEPLRADTLGIIAWTRWLDGQSSHAHGFCKLAQASQPGHRLSSLLLNLLNAGHLPITATKPH